jgi:hypothetical protein
MDSNNVKKERKFTNQQLLRYNNCECLNSSLLFNEVEVVRVWL